MRHLPPCSPLFPYTTLFRSISSTEQARCTTFTSGNSASAILGRREAMGRSGIVGSGGCRMSDSQGYDAARWRNFERSEEHTSELQSLAYLVCRLLLEKKKQI